MKQEERHQYYYNEGYNAGSVKGYEQAIKKACEWLKENMPNKFEDVQNYVDNFRKAMKGGKQ